MTTATTRAFAAPAALPPAVLIQAEAMWAATLTTAPHPLTDAAFDEVNDRLAELLRLGPGDGHDELTRCEVEHCGAWHWADEGATVSYEDGAWLQTCAAHAQADDPGARVYPGKGLEAAWRAERDARESDMIRRTGRPW